MYGHVFVVGGSFGKSGAPAMAGLGSFRSGAGLVTVAVPKEILTAVAAYPAGTDDGTTWRTIDL